eukprot:4649893-Heterocapsa_arctica.AAC.1
MAGGCKMSKPTPDTRRRHAATGGGLRLWASADLIQKVHGPRAHPLTMFTFANKSTIEKTHPVSGL